MSKKLLSILVAGWFSIGLANATTINYTTTDLGSNRWEYTYQVSDFNFKMDQGFTIFFDNGLYDLLDPFPALANGDWDALTWDPDASLPDDAGAYDAIALVDDASLVDSFTVSFDWLGGSAGPVSQYFEIYHYDWLNDEYTSLEDGFTTLASATVPEPGTFLLFGLGIAGLFLRRSQQN